MHFRVKDERIYVEHERILQNGVLSFLTHIR
jgi:hypothetical protein